MRSKFKRTLAILASVAMCSTMLLHFPNDTFNINFGISANAEENTGITANVASITNDETVTNYATFDEALANWTDGTTLTLLADVTLTEHIKTYAKGLILDLNGHKIECSDTLCTIWIDGDSGSELTIRDSQDSGHINGVVYAVAGGKLCLESGTVETVDAQGDFTMTGGQIISEDGSGLYVNGGVDAVISGGEIYGSKYGVYIMKGNVIISGDTKIKGAGQYAIRSNTSTEVVISGTPTISGGEVEFWLYEQITLNTQPADGKVWRVKINTEEITDGIFAVPGEDIALDASKFASAMDGYEVKQNAKGELLLCNHTEQTAASNGDGTHNTTCNCGEATFDTNVACSGGVATDTHQAYCEYCNAPYGELNPDVHYDIIALTMTTEELEDALLELLNSGETDISILFAENVDKEMFTAINTALRSSTAAKGSVNLTIAGVQVVTNGALGNGHPDPELNTDPVALKTLNFPDAVTLELGALTLPNVQAVYLPKVTEWEIWGIDADNISTLVLTAPGTITADFVDFRTDDIDLTLHCNKINDVTDGTTWQGVTWKSISFEHSYTCTATSANVITKECANCGKSGTLTITAEDGVYDGTTAYGATVEKTGILENEDVTVNYYQGDTLIDTALVDAGTYTAKITYEDVTASCQFEIAKATPTADMFNYSAPANCVYDGTEKPANVVVKDGITGMGEITVKYYQNGTEVTPINAGTYTVKIDVAEGDDYAAATDIEVGTFEITKATPTSDMFTATFSSGLVYDGTEKSIIVTTDKEGMGTFTVSYVSFTDSTQPVDAGTYIIRLHIEEGDNYIAVDTLSFSAFVIKKANSVISAAPTPIADLEYDGSALNLINAGTTTDGEMQYSLDGTNYSSAIPTGTDVKTYTVWYKVVGDKNHNDTEPASIEVSIAKGTPDIGTVSASNMENTLDVSEVVLSRSNETVPGTLSLAEGTTLQYGIHDYTYVFTPNDNTNYETVMGTVSITISDTNAPTATYKVGTDGWKQFINTITFGNFCKDYTTVDITYSDEGSGVADKQYYISDVEITNTEYIQWSDYTDPLNINATGKYYIYVRVTDNYGNVVIQNSEGIVVYAESVITPTSFSCEYGEENDLSVNISTNGNTFANLTDGSGNEIATDNYSIDGNTLTINGEYLSDLDVGEYTYKICMNPQGIENTEATLAYSFVVNVVAKELTVTGATATSRDYIANDKTVDITGITLSGVQGMDDVSVEITGLKGTLSSANAGTYTSVTLPTLTLTGDDAENYVLVQPTSAVATNVTINKLNPTITVGETEYYKTFGDADFTLDITDDNPEANVTYSSNDENVVTVSNGTVTIKGVGSATITVSMGASTNYNAAVDKIITVNVVKATYSVDIINKSYLYARSNADSINLAELLPEDCGTVNYASVTYNGALSFISEPKVTNGILAYTLESGAADDTGIIVVDVETQNYEVITITVNVTLIDQIPVNVDGEVELNSNILTYGYTLFGLTFKSVDFVDNAGNEVAGTLAWKEPSATPNAGTTSATWVFTPNNAEYASVEGTVAITVNKATPNVTRVPTVADRVYNPFVVLADSDLTGGTVKGVDGNSLAGSWSWQSTNVVPVVNNSGYIAVFTPTDSTNYETVTRTIAVTVEKAAPTITTEPYAAAGLVYDGSAKVLVNEGAVIGGSFVYSLTGNNFTATLPTATEAKEYTVYWRIAGDDNHNDSETFNFKVTIAKATPPALTIPTATTITYGEKLSASTLSDSSWAWVDGTIVPNANAYYNAYIEVDDSNYDYTGVDGYDDVNHRVVKGVDVIITRATLTITANSYTIKLGDTLPTYAYDVTGLVNGDTLPFNVSLSCSATDSNAVGTYPITISGVVSDALASLYAPTYENGTLTIEKKDQTITASDVTLTYGETKNIGATTNGNGAISYSTTSDVISVAADGTITAHKAGIATVTITAAETADYAEATKTISVTVNKATPNVTGVPTVADLVYDGTAQNLINAGTTTDGEMQYSLDGTNYSPAIPTGTDAKTYTLWYKVVGDENHNDTEPASIEVSIAPKSITVTADNASKTYGEDDPTFTYTATGLEVGDTLTGTLSRETGENAGTYAITQGTLANPNYEITFVKGTFTINKATPTADMFNYSAPANCLYDGNAKFATVETKAGITGIGEITNIKYYQNGTEVDPVNVGEYTVKIDVADGDNYTDIEGLEIGTFEITKATPEVTPVVPEGEYFVGDELPEIAYESKISGVIEWLTELVDGLVEGENELEWQFTPDDADNYEVVTGTAVVEAQTTTETTTSSTTTSTTTETTTSSTSTSTSTETTTSSTSTSTSTETTTSSTSTSTSTETTTSSTNTSTSTETTTSSTSTSTSTETTTSSTSTSTSTETTTSSTSTSTSTETTTSSTSTSTSTETTTSSTSTSTSTETTTSSTSTSTSTETTTSSTSTSTSTETTTSSASTSTSTETTTSSTSTSTSTETTTSSTSTSTSTETTTSSTSTSTSTETTTSSTSTSTSTTPTHIASDEELCDWAVNDYAEKTGVTPENAEIEYTADGNAVITLTDAEGNVLDVYSIDPFTGVGTESDGGEVNLPQTGYSVVYSVTANQSSGHKNEPRSTSAQIPYSVHHNESQ